MSSKKGRLSKESRKKIIIAFVAVCAIAVIAETVLLIKAFTKKKPKKQEEETQKTTVSPTPSEKPSTHKEWRITKAVQTDGTDGVERVYEYDSMGREAMHTISRNGNLMYQVIYAYTKNGKTEETWDPDKSGMRTSINFYDQTGAGFATVFETGDDYETVSETYEEKFDDEGRRTELIKTAKNVDGSTSVYRIQWEYDTFGRMIKRSVYDDSKGDMRSTSYYEYEYDSSDRIAKANYYCVLTEGRPCELLWKTEYQYDGDKKTETDYSVNESGKVYRTESHVTVNGLLVFYEVHYPDDSVSWEETYYLPDVNEALGMTNFMNNWSYYLSERTEKDGDDVEKKRTAEFDEDGRPVKFTVEEGEIAEILYDESGRYQRITIKQLSGEETVYSLSYDKDGNLTECSCNGPNISQVWNYTWELLDVEDEQ